MIRKKRKSKKNAPAVVPTEKVREETIQEEQKPAEQVPDSEGQGPSNQVSEESVPELPISPIIVTEDTETQEEQEAEQEVNMITSDNVKFSIPRKIISKCETIKMMLKDGNSGDTITLPEITSKYMQIIVDYCIKYTDCTEDPEKKTSEMMEWDAKFLDLDRQTLFELISAAEFMDVEGLLKILADKVASMIEDKTTVQIREIYNVENNFAAKKNEDIRCKIFPIGGRPIELKPYSSSQADSSFKSGSEHLTEDDSADPNAVIVENPNEPSTSTGKTSTAPGMFTKGKANEPNRSVGGKSTQPGTSAKGKAPWPGTSVKGQAIQPGTSAKGQVTQPGTSTQKKSAAPTTPTKVKSETKR